MQNKAKKVTHGMIEKKKNELQGEYERLTRVLKKQRADQEKANEK